MIKGTSQPLLLVAALVTVVSACGGGSSSESPAQQASSGTGAAVYQAQCASCHGADLTGTDEGPSQLSVVYEPNHHGDNSYRSAIANGAPQHHWNFGDMPAIEGLTDDDVEAVIAYIRSEQQRLGFEN